MWQVLQCMHKQLLNSVCVQKSTITKSFCFQVRIYGQLSLRKIHCTHQTITTCHMLPHKHQVTQQPWWLRWVLWVHRSVKMWTNQFNKKSSCFTWKTYLCLIFFQRSMWSHMRGLDTGMESVNCGKKKCWHLVRYGSLVTS